MTGQQRQGCWRKGLLRKEVQVLPQGAGVGGNQTERTLSLMEETSGESVGEAGAAGIHRAELRLRGERKELGGEQRELLRRSRQNSPQSRTALGVRLCEPGAETLKYGVTGQSAQKEIALIVGTTRLDYRSHLVPPNEA